MLARADIFSCLPCFFYAHGFKNPFICCDKPRYDVIYFFYFYYFFFLMNLTYFTTVTFVVTVITVLKSLLLTFVCETIGQIFPR